MKNAVAKYLKKTHDPRYSRVEIELEIALVFIAAGQYNVQATVRQPRATPIDLGDIEVEHLPADLLGFEGRKYLVQTHSKTWRVDTPQEAVDWLWIHYCRSIRAKHMQGAA